MIILLDPLNLQIATTFESVPAASYSSGWISIVHFLVAQSPFMPEINKLKLLDQRAFLRLTFSYLDGLRGSSS